MTTTASHNALRAGCRVLGMLLASTWLTHAEAAPRTTTIVLESHVGQRSADSATAIEPVVDELERLGFAARPNSIAKLLQGRAPRPGRLDQGKSVADIKQLIALGRGAFDKGKFSDAETALRRAVELIRRNPALLVLDTNNEKVTYSAFVALALTLSKLKLADEATAVMLELLRMSSTPIPQADYGPKAEEIHSNAQKQAQALGRGSLAIAVNDDRAMVFVDGQFRGLGKVALGDLIPGTHHVLVQVPGTGGLQYVRTVQTNEPSRLDVDWPLETMVHIEDPWAGLIFPTEADRAKEAVYAGELARRLRRDDLIIIGLTQLNGVSYVVGTQYPANGDPPIGAFAPVSGGEALLRSLARYLYDGTMAAGLRVLPRSSVGVSPAIALRDSEPRSPSTLLPKVVAGAGVLTVAAGAIAYKVSRGYDPVHPSGDNDGKNPTVFAMLGGSAVLGGGTYLWLRESTFASRLSAGLWSIGTAGMVAGAVLYLADQDQEPHEPRYIRDTAPAGVVIGASGVTLTGLGVFLLYRERHESSTVIGKRRDVPSWTPTIALGPSGAIMSCAGRF